VGQLPGLTVLASLQDWPHSLRGNVSPADGMPIRFDRQVSAGPSAQMRRWGRLIPRRNAIYSLLSFTLGLALLAIFAFSSRRCSRARVVFSCNFIGQENTRVRRTTTSQPVSLQSNCTSTGGTPVTPAPSRRACAMTTRGVTQRMSYYSDGGITAPKRARTKGGAALVLGRLCLLSSRSPLSLRRYLALSGGLVYGPPRGEHGGLAW
jgi:hypothetical protein